MAAATPLPWSQLAWTFPLITALSGFPSTVAGAGLREGAAILLLGLYGLPAPVCVAAALLTFAHHGLWAGVGEALLWREQRLQARRAKQPLARTISVIIPSLNEMAVLAETIRCARAVPEVREVILVDGGSSDGTRETAAQLGCRVLRTGASRGHQLRLGASQARGDVVLLLHADTWLGPEAGRAALNCLRDATVVAGGFWKAFRRPPWLTRGSRWRCAWRILFGKRILGDQALFVRRERLEAIDGVPDMALMEDLELCRRLRKVGRLALACGTVSTSPRRFEKLGVLRTYFRMWRVSVLYRLGAPPHELSEIYERE